MSATYCRTKDEKSSQYVENGRLWEEVTDWKLSASVSIKFKDVRRRRRNTMTASTQSKKKNTGFIVHAIRA